MPDIRVFDEPVNVETGCCSQTHYPAGYIGPAPQADADVIIQRGKGELISAPKTSAKTPNEGAAK